MSASSVAALVVNWSTPDDLYQLVMSAEHLDPGMEWYVVQHPHSHINSTPVLRSLEDALGHRFRVRMSGFNYGHGWGINTAADWAMRSFYPYLFILNPDVKFVEPVTKRLTDFLEARPKAIAVGPKQLDSKGRITAGGIIGTNENPRHRDFHANDPKNEKHRDMVQCPMIAGSAMMVKAPEFMEYRLLESSHYYSETWFCYHARAHGHEVWYWGEPTMIHEWHTSSPVGYEGTDGQFKVDRELFRRMCDEHEPQIARD